MVKDSFFATRTIHQMRRLEHVEVDARKESLILPLRELDPSKQVVVVKTPKIEGLPRRKSAPNGILEERFVRGTSTMQEAAMKSLRHGRYLELSSPRTIGMAFRTREHPHQIRQRDFEYLLDTPEEGINSLGYSFRPVQGTDRRLRFVLFDSILEGTRMLVNCVQEDTIEIIPYDDARRASREGAQVIVQMSSRSKRHSNGRKVIYKAKVTCVPVVDNDWQFVIPWGTNVTYSGGGPETRMFGELRYKEEEEREGSNFLIMSPHDIAAWLAVTRHYIKQPKNNKVPWNGNPFAKPSAGIASDYMRLLNNVLVEDVNSTGKDRLRKLYVAERSILIARAVGQTKDGMLWANKRDPKLTEYDWSIPT